MHLPRISPREVRVVAGVLAFTLAASAASAAPALAVTTMSPVTASNIQASQTAAIDQSVISALDTIMTVKSVGDVVNDANRQGSSCSTSVPGAVKYCWTDDDNDGDWSPQGLTSSWDSSGTDTVAGKSILLSAWIDKDDPGKSVRVAFFDRTTKSYRLTLLVRPTGTAAAPNFVAEDGVHAGGLAWYGHYLYVTDTHRLRVFDMNHIWRANTSDSKASTTIGKTSSGVFAADGTKYVIPEVYTYDDPSSSNLRWSDLGLDRTSSPDSLIVTEYYCPGEPDCKDATDTSTMRTVRFPLDETTGLPAVNGSGKWVATEAYDTTIPRLQGGVAVNGTWFFAQYDGMSQAGTDNDWGDMFKATPSSSMTVTKYGNALPITPEGLIYWGSEDRLWLQTENQGLRGIYGIKRTTF